MSNPLTEARQPALATSDGTIRAFWLAGADELPALVYRLLDRSGPPPRGPIAALTGPGAFVMQHRVASVPGGFLVAWTDVEAQARVALIGTDGGVRWTASLSDLEDPRAVRIGTLGVVAAAPPAVQLVLVVQPDIRKASVRFVRFGLDGVRFEDVEVPDASFLAADMSEGAVTLWSQEMSRGKLTHCARRYALTGKPLGAAACDTSDGPRARAARARTGAAALARAGALRRIDRGGQRQYRGARPTLRLPLSGCPAQRARVTALRPFPSLIRTF